MNEVITNIPDRRSVRKYKQQQITEQELVTVLQADIYAPNAGSRQGTVAVVMQGPAILAELGKINRSAFHGKMSTAQSYISKE